MPNIKDIRALMTEIKASMPLSKAMSKYIHLEKDGAGYSCLCPFEGHQETVPSFKVNDEKSIWKCWGSCSGDKSRVGRDIIAFIQSYFDLSFIEAVEKFSQDFGIDLSHHYRPLTPEEQYFEYYTAVNKIVADCCVGLLAQNQSAIDMFTVNKRISYETLQQFSIGYCPDIGMIHKALQDYNVDDQHVIALDLKRFEMWSNRIIYPIMTRNNKIIGFRNRALSPGAIKFIGTSTESVLYSHMPPVYGLQVACRHIRQADQTVNIVEGQNDVLHMHDAGICNTVASMGINLSHDTLAALTNYNVRTAIVMFDGDKAGLQAMDNLCSNIEPVSNLVLRTTQLPDGQDPDEFLRDHDVSDMYSILSSSEHFLTHFLNKIDLKSSSIIDKHLYLNKARARLMSLDSTHQSMCLSDMARRLDIPYDTLEDYYKPDFRPDMLFNLDAEVKVLQGMILNDDVRLRLADELNSGMFYIKSYAMIFDIIVNMVRNNYVVDPSSVWFELTKRNAECGMTRDQFDLLLLDVPQSYDIFIDEFNDRYVRRNADALADKIKLDIRNDTVQMDTILDHINDSVTKLITNNNSYSIDDHALSVDRTMQKIQENASNPGVLPGVDLGPDFSCLTNTVGGLRAGTMYVVAGLPGIGKTAMAEKWSLHQAVIQGVPILWVALEMSQDALNMRNMSILSTMSGTSNIMIHNLERGELTYDQQKALVDIAKRYKHAPYYSECNGDLTIQQLIALIRYHKHVHDIKAVYIDYVQLLNSDERYNQDWQMQKSISKALTKFANSIDISIVAISQLSRTALGNGKNDHETIPSGKDIAGSVQWWADADAVICPFAKSRAQIDYWTNKGPHGINVSKNRNGATGLIHATYHGPWTTWVEVANQEGVEII